jgi:mono/diheme cytochrome c family protein
VLSSLSEIFRDPASIIFGSLTLFSWNLGVVTHAGRVASRSMIRKMFLKVSRWVLIVAVLIQLIPFGHTHTNPPTTREPVWNVPETRALFQRACFDCHSDQTVWRWYSNVAPVSWLVQRDVNEGRRHLNFSQWDKPQRHGKDIAGEVNEGDMPPWFYLPMHAAARLTIAEKQALIDGAIKTFGPQTATEGRASK